MDMGKPIGNKGQTSIRVIVGNDGKNMERIPCELSMIIEYSNLSVGNISSTSQVFSEIEGDLAILINGTRAFFEHGILLLELAKEINEWLGGQKDIFEYYSMDYEEGPIFFVRKEKADNWKVGGVWFDEIYYDLKISDITYACRQFVNELFDELAFKKINLNMLF